MSGLGLKLGSLFIRQISKPIANALKAQAKEHEAFKKLCISLAQSVHKADITLRMKLLGEQGSSKVRPLNDNRAIENGANFLSETFVFSVAGAIIVYEANRQRQKELTRREAVEDDIKTLQHEIEYLKKKLQDYNVRLDDYIPLKDAKPKVLKLDEHGNMIDIHKQMNELNARIDELNKKVPVDSESPSSSSSSSLGTSRLDLSTKHSQQTTKK